MVPTAFCKNDVVSASRIRGDINTVVSVGPLADSWV